MRDAEVLELELSDVLKDPASAIEKAQKKQKSSEVVKGSGAPKAEKRGKARHGAPASPSPPGGRDIIDSIVMQASGAATPFSAEIFLADRSSCQFDVPELSTVVGPDGPELAVSDSLTATGWQEGELYNMDHGPASSRRADGSRFLRLHRLEAAVAVITCIGAWLDLGAYICINVVPGYRSVGVLMTMLMILAIAVVLTIVAVPTKVAREICRSMIRPYLGILLSKAGEGSIVLVYACASYPVVWSTTVEVIGSSLSIAAMVAGLTGLLGSVATSTTSVDYIRRLLGIGGKDKQLDVKKGESASRIPLETAPDAQSPPSTGEAPGRSPGDGGSDQEKQDVGPSPAASPQPIAPAPPEPTVPMLPPDVPTTGVSMEAKESTTADMKRRKRERRSRKAGQSPESQLAGPKTTL